MYEEWEIELPKIWDTCFFVSRFDENYERYYRLKIYCNCIIILMIYRHI